MDDLDLGVVYDVLSKNFLDKHKHNQYQRSPVNMDTTSDKVLFGGPLTIDLTKEVDSLGEYMLKCLRQQDPKGLAFVSITILSSSLSPRINLLVSKGGCDLWEDVDLR